MSWSKTLLSKTQSKVWLRRFFVCLFLFGALFASTSCQLEGKESYLIIALDHLPSDSINCSEEKLAEPSGLNILCQESVRFTHSYTTSLQPAAAMASLLTGTYPFQHRLNRSFDRLNPRTVLLSDIAQSVGYRTAFFSGSPNILRKTGLARSFEVFDDSIATQPQGFFKDFRKQSEDFLNWAGEESKPFLAVIYNSELESINETDTNTANIDKIDEKLFTLFRAMKKNNLWEKTYVVLVGLQGNNKYNRLDETNYTNLHSENTSVATLIKPPRSKGDDGISWKSDATISLADVGLTLRNRLLAWKKSVDLKTLQPEPKTPAEFAVTDVSAIWSSQQELKIPERTLVVEAANPWLKDIVEERYALIYRNYLYIEHEKDRIYNTLADGLETIDLSQSNPEVAEIFQKKISLIRAANNNAKWFQRFPLDLSKLNYDYWSSPTLRANAIKKKPSENNPLTIFLIQSWLKNKNDESQLKQWAHNKKNRYAQFAQKNINSESPIDICYILLNKKNLSRDDLKSCSDELFLQYIRYKKATTLDLNADKNRTQYLLLRKNYLEDVRRHSMNLALENIWGLYDPTKNWIHPLVFLDEDFFN